jgi:hypothetical protein
MSSQPDSDVIVIVEDPWIRKFLSKALDRAGYRAVELAASDAAERLRSGELHVKALITNTPSAFRPVAGQFPLIYTTSCPDPKETEGFRQCCVLQKPFHAGQLMDALHEVCDVVIP